jgi:vanillin dehydrogenase
MKPSEDAPITGGLLLADVLTEAWLLAQVPNVVTNDLADAGDVVAALIADPRVRMVNFTGSTDVGRIIGSKPPSISSRRCWSSAGRTR